ncbi:MAG: tRNA 4-thiouridine(8) synthase ThiI, partial [Clostridia bacterium]|nr:tRNA 4-thiouridine(8) synthase ThiI [Clostridia bacterium]
MKEILLCKYGEILLKGANKRYFEDTLTRELRIRARCYGHFDVYRSQSTLYVEPKDEHADVDGMFEAARKVFGIVSVGRSAMCEKNMDAICELAKTYLPDKLAGKRTFKVEGRRSDKSFPLGSIEIAREVGG